MKQEQLLKIKEELNATGSNKNIVGIYCIFNKVQGEYSLPLYCLNITLAKRRFAGLLENTRKNPLTEATDYQLFSIGFYNNKTAVTTSWDTVEFIQDGFLKDKVE